MSLTREAVVSAMLAKNYKVFEKLDFDMNVVGLRAMPGQPNAFDDTLCLFYRERGVWQFHAWPCTTDPGKYHLQNPGNVNGTAIVIPGQYRGAWELGFHHRGQSNQYEALVQAKAEAFKVWRDRTKDGTPDYKGQVYTDATGINCHHAGVDSTYVEKWSAGCTVFKRLADFQRFMSLVKKQKAAGIGETFTYTLLEWPS